MPEQTAKQKWADTWELGNNSCIGPVGEREKGWEGSWAQPSRPPDRPSVRLLGLRGDRCKTGVGS